MIHATITLASIPILPNPAYPNPLISTRDGVAQRRLGRFDDAEKSLLEAQKLDKGKTPSLYWETALLYGYDLKRYQDAADQLELFLKADRNNPNADNIRKVIARLRQNLPPSE